MKSGGLSLQIQDKLGLARKTKKTRYRDCGFKTLKINVKQLNII
jgi:hypothetical protein